MDIDFVSLLLLILLGRTLGLAFARYKFQSLIGEILAGVILSPLIFGLVPNDTLKLFSQFGIIMLMLLSGLLTDFKSFSENKLSSIVVGVLGVVFSIIFLFFTLRFFGVSLEASLFLSVILSNTAVEVCANLLMKSENASKDIHAVIMGASFVDDIVAVFLIGVVGSITLNGELKLDILAYLSVKVVAFILISLLVIPYLFEKFSVVDKLIGSGPRREKVLLSFTILFAIFMGLIAQYAGLQTVIGAYIAGLIIGRWGSKVGPLLKRRIAYEELVDDIDPFLHALFTPLFFGYVGLKLGSVISQFGIDYWAMFLVLALTAAAMLGKFMGCGFGARITGFDAKSSYFVGIAMGGRGALELVLLTIVYDRGIISGTLFASVVMVTLLTVIITPLMFSLYERRLMASP